MELYEFALYFLLFSLGVSIVTGIRVSARRGLYNSLVGVSIVIIALATALVVIGEIFPIQFSRDIALYLLALATMGALLISKIIKGEGI
jgi:energy-converting hydrogenase B subunit B